MAHTHGQVKFHGPTQPGTFQTGKAEIIKFWSAHHFEETGVLATRDELVDDGLLPTNDLTANSIEIGGTTYSVDANYDSAFVAQHNFNALIKHFATIANVVSINITSALASGTSLASDFANVYLGVGADTFGSEVVFSNGLAWSVAIVLEQKGILHNSAGSGNFVRGMPSIGSTAGNFGTTVADVEAFLEGLVLHATGALAIGGDLENMDDVENQPTFTGINIVTGTNEAWQGSGSVGAYVTMITNGNGDAGTSQSVLVDPTFVASDLQS